MRCYYASQHFSNVTIKMSARQVSECLVGTWSFQPCCASEVPPAFSWIMSLAFFFTFVLQAGHRMFGSTSFFTCSQDDTTTVS